MRKINLPLVTDTLFTAFIAFVLFFTAIRHYTKNAVWGLIFGACAAVLFGTLAFLYISGKQRKKILLSQDENKKNALMLHLSLSPESEAEKLIKSLYGAEKTNLKPENAEAVFFPLFRMAPLSEDDVAKVVKFPTEKRKVLLCNRLCDGAKSLADDFLIETVTADGFYLKVKENDLLPEKFVYEEKKKPSGFKRIKARFTRKLFRPLFLSGLALMLFAPLTYFTVYYMVVGGILLTLSAAALIFGKT